MVLTQSGDLKYFKEANTKAKPLNQLNLRSEGRSILTGKFLTTIGVAWPSEATESTTFGIVTKDRSFFFVAENSAECQNWVRKCQKVRPLFLFDSSNFIFICARYLTLPLLTIIVNNFRRLDN